ncbi:MAG: hypothetical protein ATN31_06055 [Candidatus Epulonipiscioides saccharophilum]|nr:MAG: hypothetical protein ATN31_06055 [Epulopiscium sp. AS2M-Bin001]
MNSKPNFLVICVDQMQSYSLGINGNEQIKTPNLDELGKTGTSFNRAYCANSVCMPSRASMFTGLTPKQHGLTVNGMKLNEDLPTIAGVLHKNGYRTYGAGKFHLQPTRPLVEVDSFERMDLWENGTYTKLPAMYYGFEDTFFVNGHGSGAGAEYANWLAERGANTDMYQRAQACFDAGFKNNTWRMDIPDGLHYNEVIADKTIDFMNNCADNHENFFAWCSFPDPHAPFLSTKPYCDMYDPNTIRLNATWQNTQDSVDHLIDRRKQLLKGTQNEAELREIVAQTYGMITHVDANVGRLVNALKEKNILDNTVIIFIADHGEYLGSHGLLHKSDWQYEELVRVPFIWNVPNGKANGLSQDVVSALDLVPTILDYANVSEEEFATRGINRATCTVLPGRSLKNYLDNGDELQPQPAYIEYDEDWFAGEFYRTRTIVTEKYKLTHFINAGDGLMFDLENDLAETNNLFFNEKFDKIKADLNEQLLFHLIKTDRNDVPRHGAF